MSDSPGSVPGAASRFFDRYLTCLDKAAVPEKRRRWYVRRVEEFIKAQNGHKIKSLGATEIGRYFEMLGRQNRLQGWQFGQCVHAIRILYCDLFASPAGKDVDWQFWLDSARQWDADHPSTARELSPEELTWLKQRKGEGPLQRIRASHRDLLVRLASEIRRRAYAYRTEQSYEAVGLPLYPFLWRVRPRTGRRRRGTVVSGISRRSPSRQCQHPESST